MFRALYDYKTDMKQYLSFQTGDQFTVIDNTHQDWYFAQNGFGEIGFIPKNYVVQDQASEMEVLRSVDRAIEVIHYEAGSKGGQYTHKQRENLKKLIEHRENIIKSFKTQVEPSDWVMVPEQTVEPQHIKGEHSQRRSVRRAAPAPPTRSSEAVSHEAIQSRSKAPNASSYLKDTPENSDSNHSQTASVSFALPQTDILTRLQDCSLLNGQNAGKCEENSNSVINNLQEQNKEDGSKKDTSVEFSSRRLTGIDVTSVSGSASNPAHATDNLSINCKIIHVPDHLGNSLVEEIRKNTGLSYDKSCVAMETVLTQIGLCIPDVSELMDRIYATFKERSAATDEEEVYGCDFDRLCELFKELADCKDDSQQRGWHLHEDEGIINRNLKEILSILENAKPELCRRALAIDEYEAVHNFVQYYQMENRLGLRTLLLQVFGAMCSLDRRIITLLLYSVLTTELKEELQQNIDDVARSGYVTLVLTMLFCTGEPVPGTLHDYVNKEFLQFVFTALETPPTEAHEEQLTDLFVNFLLAFNLHFFMPDDNLVMKVLEERKTAKVFTEKILLLFNRDDDPVCMFEYQKSQKNCVMKLLQDMYSSRSTANILYTNDAKVLIDIILQHLTDLPPGDMNRSAHLKLMQLYLQNADYSEHTHRYAELHSCLHRIHEEEEETGDDKHICEFIFRELNLFVA